MERIPIEQNEIDTMSTIKEAASNRQTLAIRYQDKSNDITTRIVEPYEIKDGKLFAYCRDKEGIRAFLLKSIMGTTIGNDHYDPRFEVKIDNTSF